MTSSMADSGAVLAMGATPIATTRSLVHSWLGAPVPLHPVEPTDIARMQLPRRFGLAIFAPGFFDVVPVHEHRLAVHNVVAHLEPSARVVAFDIGAHGDYADHARACGLKLLADGCNDLAVVHRRTSRTTIHDLVAEARAGLKRLGPADLSTLLTLGVATVLDTRTPTDRERFGVIPGSFHMPRTTLEWMCDPASGYSHECIDGFDQLLVTVCNEGYSSSLAAASLQRLGFHQATDLVGGVLGWRAAGLPIEQPDHTRFN